MCDDNKQNEDGIELFKMIQFTNSLHAYNKILCDVTFVAIATGNHLN